MTLPEFESMIEQDELLEWAEYGGNLYGTPRRPIEDAMAAGTDIILDIENDGAHQVKTGVPQAVAIFIVPPSLTELERRLRLRGDTSDDDIERRLAVAAEQMDRAAATYDHIVVNDELSVAIEEVLSILSPSG